MKRLVMLLVLSLLLATASVMTPHVAGACGGTTMPCPTDGIAPTLGP